MLPDSQLCRAVLQLMREFGVPISEKLTAENPILKLLEHTFEWLNSLLIV